MTLNDAAFFEMAQGLALRICREGGSTAADRVRFGLRLALLRPPAEVQVRALETLYQSELAHYRTDPEAARNLFKGTPGGIPSDVAPAELAAWVVVSNVLLNLDALLMKG